PASAIGSPSGVSPSLNCTVPPFAAGATLAVRVTGVPFLALPGPARVVLVALSASAMLVVASGPAPPLRGALSLSRGEHWVGAHAVMNRVAFGRNVRKFLSLAHAPASPPVRSLIWTFPDAPARS